MRYLLSHYIEGLATVPLLIGLIYHLNACLVASELQRDAPWLRKPEQSTQRTFVAYSGSACLGNGRRKCISKRRAAVTGLTLLPKSAVSSVSGNEGTGSEATGPAVNASCSSRSLDETNREFIMDILQIRRNISRDTQKMVFLFINHEVRYHDMSRRIVWDRNSRLASSF